MMPKLSSIKFLIDESVEFRIVEFLRENSFDTLAITEEHPSLADIEVLSIANRQRRILVTNDADFGRLIFKEGKEAYGVIFLRLPVKTTRDKIIRLSQVLEVKIAKLPHSFVTVTEKRIRSRELQKIEG